MSIFPPNTPTVNAAPVRTPQDITDKQLRIVETSPWGIFYRNIYTALVYLLGLPVSLNGLAAALPDATLYPENSRYWATNTTTEYIVIYATPGDPTTAAWVAM